MRPSMKTALISTGSAVAASAATAAVLLPLGSAFAEPSAPAEDWGRCTGPYVKDITLEEALPYLEEEGYTPAAGPLDGYEITYVPDFAAGEPFDSSWEWEEEGEDWPAESSRVWIDPDALQLETWPDEDGKPAEQYVMWDSGLSVSVQRDDRIKDVDSYLEEFHGITPEEYSEGQDVRELESGQGYYTGSDALWVPEPGVALTLSLWDPAWEGEDFPEEYFEEGAYEEEWDLEEMPVEPTGDHEEVRKIVEGIVPA